jgi:hypothetical protein
MNCPGRCGFATDDADKHRMHKHVMTCPKGAAVAEQLRRFALWMLDELGTAFEPDRWQDPYSQCSDWNDLSRTLVTTFLGMGT